MNKCQLKYSILGTAFGLSSRYADTQFGPAEFRKRGIMSALNEIGVDVTDEGDVGGPSAPTTPRDKKLNHIDEFLEFCDGFLPRIQRIFENGRVPIVLGGEHSASIPSISAASDYARQRSAENPDIGVLWIGGHPDLHTSDTTLTGNIHEMSAAVLLGHGDSRLCSLCNSQAKLKPGNLVYIGLRHVEPGEKDKLNKLPIAAYTMTDIDRFGIGAICEKALEKLCSNGKRFVVSFDFGACDPEIAPAVGTPLRGGLTFREAHLILEMVASTNRLLALEVMELNPVRDVHQITIRFGIHLIQSALGLTII